MYEKEQVHNVEVKSGDIVRIFVDGNLVTIEIPVYDARRFRVIAISDGPSDKYETTESYNGCERTIVDFA